MNYFRVSRCSGSVKAHDTMNQALIRRLNSHHGAAPSLGGRAEFQHADHAGKKVSVLCRCALPARAIERVVRCVRGKKHEDENKRLQTPCRFFSFSTFLFRINATYTYMYKVLRKCIYTISITLCIEIKLDDFYYRL